MTVPARLPALLFPALLLACADLAADTGYYETEPNDTPDDFNEVSGDIVLYGTMVGDDQDGFLWTVSDDDARKRWTFELNGEPGALTIAQIMRIGYADNGVDVAERETLFKMGTRDGVTPSIHRDLLFEPGEYVIGLAQAGAGRTDGFPGGARPKAGLLFFGPLPGTETTGGEDAEDSADATADAAAPAPPPNTEPGAYRMIIARGEPIYPQPNPKGRDSRDNAHPLRPRSAFSTFESAETAWYRLAFDQQDAQTRHDLRVQAPVGRDLRARLLNADGDELLRGRTDDKGKLRFPDLAPVAGEAWYLELTAPEPGFFHVISTEAVGQRVSGQEAEPNNDHHFANRIDFEQPVTGRIGGDDPTDNFLFTAGEDTADELRTIRIEADPPSRLQLCLRRSDWSPAQCRDGESPVELPDLSLDAGDWGITVERAPVETAYTLSLASQGPVLPDQESEPNDRIEIARGLPEKLRIKGRFTGDDTDFYEILVSEEAQLWRFQVIGEKLFELGYYDGAGHQRDKVRVQGNDQRLRLDNVFLLPGRHYIRVAGKAGGSYTLLARALGPPDPNGEMEPNDAQNKQRLAVGQTRTGTSSAENDQDYYRFFVANWDHLRLTFSPPVDGLVIPKIYWYDNIIAQGRPGGPGEPLVLQGLFPPGDYHVVLEPQQLSDAEYRLQLERLPRFSCPADCEPNGQGLGWMAAPLPSSLVLEGRSGEWRDIDYYQLPVFEQPADLLIRTAEPTPVSLGPARQRAQALKYDTDLGAYATQVPAGGPYRLYVDSREKPYRLQLEFPNGELRAVVEPLPAQLELSFEHDAVSAFRVEGQAVDGRLAITSASPEPLDLQLEAATSDHRWQVRLDPPVLRLPANGTASADVRFITAADAWADRPVRISVRALDGGGRQAETWQDISVDRQLPSVNPVLHWAVPEALRGGLNVAWLPFGAEWTSDTVNWATRTGTIRDGVVFDGARAEGGGDGDGWSEGEHPELTLDLPGDDPLPVAGTAIDGFGTPGAFFDIREATLLLSMDGVNFDEVLRFEALPVETEQQFALEAPVPARFARLRIDSTFREPSAERVFMAEWKVILEPGHDLSGGEGFDIARPDLGGHLTWYWPPEGYAPTQVLEAGTAAARANTGQEETKEYVVGFLNDRAAQVTRIEWHYPEGLSEERKVFDRVLVTASLDSPTGPWLPLGEMDLGAGQDAATIELPEPAWARFVRFSAQVPAGRKLPFAPDVLRIWERPTDAEYRSVLSEWGDKGTRAYYEWQAGLQTADGPLTTGNTSRDTAAAMAVASPVRGQVVLGELSHWYRLAVPAGQNTLTLTLQGDPTVRTVVELENAAGEGIPLRRIDRKETPSRHEFEAVVEAGSEVWFHVFEPPRNIAFAWDTSASVNPYIPMINNAIVAFSGQVVPGQERVNLFPFPTGPLLDEWLGEPYMLQTILNDYRRPSSSSDAEKTLKIATQALGPLAGTKAIVVITDGDTTHDGAMWGEMLKTRPRVFSVQVAGSAMWHQHVTRDWATVNGGHFTQLLYQGEMEVAFDRATTLLHRPAGYSMQVDSEYREAPGPGLLSVIASDGDGAPASASAAVELILDASGSMLKRMDGKRRIAIAKEVLTEAVQQHIPAGTPVALRVFGHKEADSCRTDLEIPLGPLDPATAAARIDGINAMNLARTPIADSLKAIEGDLKGARGGVVVLVTDGEETCDGDPAAVIGALQAKGFDVSLNIVGFAIDDPELAATFASWAALGGGRYLAADNPEGLSDAIEQALRIPFTVYDVGGNEVAAGEVGGEPLELEQGYYRIVVKAAKLKTFENVLVQGENEVILELD